MFGNNRIIVVMPAHNEGKLITRAVMAVPDFVDTIIVVDDASTDDTAAVLTAAVNDARIVLIRHDDNRGVGGAIVTGYKRALAIGADVVAVMAGDAQMDPCDLPFLLEPILKGRCDYAKGDRLSWPGVFKTMPLLRFIGNHVLTLLTRISSGFTHLRDSQCGYTAVTKDCLQRIDLDALWPRYGFPNDILARIHAVNGRIENVAVKPIYGEEISGISFATALFRVPMVLLRSLIWRWKRERRARKAMDMAPLNPVDG